MQDSFVNLRVRTEYSGDSTLHLSQAVARAWAIGQKALAITDFNSLSGVVKFASECHMSGIKPIIGMETRVTYADDRHNVILIATNKVGWKNLVTIHNLGVAATYHYLALHAEGLIAIAVESAPFEKLVRVFGQNNTFVAAENSTSVLTVARKACVGIVAAPLVRSLDAEHAQHLQKHMQVIHWTTERPTFTPVMSPDQYLKSSADMASAMRGFKIAVSATADIAARCEDNVLPEMRDRTPTFPEPTDWAGPHEYLSHLVYGSDISGASSRGNQREEVRTRINAELQVIKERGLANQILIVNDLVQKTRAAGIGVGPGRGSAAGSKVLHCLGVTKVDPVAHGLLFDRFLDTSRLDRIAIDIDVSATRRPDVVELLASTWGSDRVAIISSFSSVNENLVAKRTVDRNVPFAGHLAGMRRIAMASPAYVLVSDEPLDGLVPMKTLKAGEPVVCWNRDDLESLGFFYLAVLGNKTVEAVAAGAVAIPDPQKHRGLDVEAAWAAFGTDDGLFSASAARGIPELPTSLRGMAEAIALNHPNRPTEAEPPLDELFASVESQLGLGTLAGISVSDGRILFQESLMEIATAVSGYTSVERSRLRKSLAKGNQRLIAEELELFKVGSVLNEFDTVELFEAMVRSAPFAFCAAHAYSYAQLAFDNAYMVAHGAPSVE